MKTTTQSVHAGESRSKPHGAVTTPIYQTSTYSFTDTAEMLQYMQRKVDSDPENRDEYGRYGNPTMRTAERKIAALEGCEKALLFSSGMNAITTLLLALLTKGDHLVMTEGIYKRTQEFAEKFLPQYGIHTTLVAIDNLAAVEAAIRPETRMVFSETPTNPYLRVIDLTGLASIARKHNLISAVDVTFATPINLQARELGIDLLVHSATKYLGGHNDLLAGAVAGPGRILSTLEYARGIFGGVGSALDAYLLIRGMKTLSLRMAQHNQNGMQVAQFLESHPAVARVYYPGLPSHPDYQLAQKQMNGFGGVVSFELKGDFSRTANFIDRLKIPYKGPTLGGVESVIVQPATLLSLNPKERKAAGIPDNLVRYALGIEDAHDLIEDIQEALR
jgi:cystathionine gamma-synthase